MNTKTKSFSSDMTGLPALSGTAGALIAILDAVLVNGYGSTGVVSLSVTGTVATATYASGHPFKVDTVGMFAGATPAGLNGEKRILTVSANTVTFDATGVVAGAATGTITSKVAAAGWTKLFTGTNLAAYKSLAPESTGCILRVDDTGTKNARVRAFEAMSDISTGQGPTPLDAQCSGGLYWPKSSSADGTARVWLLVADERGFHFTVAPNGGDKHTLLWAGDIASLKSGDAYGYVVTGNQSDQSASATVPDGCNGYSHRSPRTGAYVVRASTGIGQSTAVQRVGTHHNGITSDVYAGLAGYSLGAYPNSENNGLLTAPLEVVATSIRGSFPGLLHCVQDMAAAFATGAYVDGTNDFAGRRLLAIRTGVPAGSSAGTVLIDATGLWSR